MRGHLPELQTRGQWPYRLASDELYDTTYRPKSWTPSYKALNRKILLQPQMSSMTSEVTNDLIFEVIDHNNVYSHICMGPKC